MNDVTLVLGLLALVAIVASVAERLRLPSPILMLLTGIALGVVPALGSVDLEPDTIFNFFLPPLLYVAAFFAPLRRYRADARAIGNLAVGLVLATTAGVALSLHVLLPSLPVAAAVALGAIVAPPDAVAATSVLQRIGVPRRLVNILEGESLLNDATALVTYRLAVAAVVSGTFAFGDAVTSFIAVAAGGVIVGIAVSAAATALRARVLTPASITISLLIPFVAYLGAERLGASGVLAAVTAGLYAGRRRAALSSEVRIVGGAVWQMIAFVLNGMLFVLVGLQLHAVVADLGETPLTAAIGLGVAVSAVAIAIRLGWIFLTANLPRGVSGLGGTGGVPKQRAIVVVGWAGMRGAVSLAAALALPRAIPERDLLIFITFVVIVVTLVGQGLTLPPLAHRLGVVAVDDLDAETAQARAVVAESAQQVIPSLRTSWPGHLPLIDRLATEYEHRAEAAELHRAGDLDAAEQERLEHREIEQALIDVERTAAREMHARGAITDEVLRRLERDLDLSELRD